MVARELEGYRSDVSIAALNGPANTVISGRGNAVEELFAKFARAGIKSKRLTVSHAFHSPLMEPMLDDFRSIAAKVKYNPPQIPLISNVSGKVASAQEMSDAAYWVRHVRAAVNFSGSMKTLQERGCRVFLELGPAPTLSGMAAKCLPDGFGTWLPSLRKERGDWQQMLASLAALYVRGAEVDWKGFDRDYQRRPVVLPTYPFQRSRYWVDLPECGAEKNGTAAAQDKTLSHPLLNHRIDSPFIDDVLIEARLSAATLPWLKDHQAFGATVFPATGYLEMILASAKEALGPRAFVIRDMDIREAMILEDETVRRVQISIRPENEDQASFKIASVAVGEASTVAKWKVHAAGKVHIAAATELERAHLESLDEVRSRCTQEISVESYHHQFLDLGMYLGPSFKGLQKLWSGSNEILGEVHLVPEITPEASFYCIHPGMLDPCLQPFAAAALTPAELASGNAIYMPVAIGSYAVYRDPGKKVWSHVVVSRGNGEALSANSLTVDTFVFDSAGALVAELREVALRRVERQAVVKLQEEPLRDWLYELSWKEASLGAEEGPAGTASLLDPPDIAEALRTYTVRQSKDDALADFTSLFPQLEALSTRYVLQALGRLGWTTQEHERFTAEAKAAELNIPEKYRRLFGRMLEMLDEDGILERRNEGWEVCGSLQVEDSGLSAEQLLRRYPDCSAELNMTIRCGEHLAAVIRDECEPLDLLFPDGSTEDIEKLYRDSPFSRFCNGLVGTAVRALAAQWPADRPLRVLEIGGGTGSTTASVLPELPAARTEYVFTDASPLFFSKAREKFGDYPFMEYRLLDIEKSPAAQGFEAQSYDLVIAANVLHATEDLKATLTNVRALVASEGVLLLLEGTRPIRFGDVIVGLTEGWWRFTDTELRPAHALISSRKWKGLLEDCGFTRVTVSPDSGGVFANQAVIVSRAPRIAVENKSSIPAPQANGTWMIFADRDGLGESLQRLLMSRGARCATVIAADKFATIGEARYQISPRRPEDFRRVLQEAAYANGSAIEGVVYLWPLDLPNGSITGCDDLNSRVQYGCESLLHLVKALAAEGTVKADSLWIVTRGAQTVDSSAGPAALAQAPVSAMGSTVALEHPELRCSRIDLDPYGDPNEVTALNAELRAGNEDLVAFRRGRRHIARLTRARLDQAAENRESQENARAYQLQSSSPGFLDCLALEPLERRSPAAGEVEVEVLATGLNFRDVLIAMGQYPGDSQVFGYECAGNVMALGEGVHHLHLGQRVMVMGPGSFASHVTVPAAHVIPVPESLSNDEAASIPSAFLTAYYALCHLGRITAGDRILIHAATGGVGLAAVQLAQQAGAEIFATAGSPRKREYLKALGVAHVMDSRSLEFAAEIMRGTEGKGVDIVLNSLAGEFISKTFSITAENGRFLEIGMTGIWDQARVAQLTRNISYHPINLAATFREDPQLISRLLAELMKKFEDGRLKPLPLTVFPIEQVTGAFRYMAQARHIGKIILTHRTLVGAGREAAAGTRKARMFDPNAGYMITGGLAGLGLLAAEWLVRSGARYVILTGRSQPSAQALEAIRAMERQGAQVVIELGDVSDRTHLEQVIAKFGGIRPPLAGVIHSAGALDDGVLLHQNGERFQRVFAPKIAGSWHLHEFTRNLPLDFFVMFSSAVSLLGSAGQGNHVAACAFEDSLAYYRRALGLPALSIDWGPWGETGAATRGTVSRRVQLKGFQPIQPEQGFRVLERLVQRAPARIGVMSVDWSKYADSVSTGSAPALLSELSRKTKAASPKPREKTEPSQALIERLNGAAAAKRQNLLSEYVQGQAMKVLGLGASQPIDLNQPLNDLGLDSLMAVELRSLLSAGLGLSRSLPATLVFDYPTIASLTGYLAKEVLGWEKAAVPEIDAPQEDDLAGLLDRIEGLSEEEVDRMYNQEEAIS
ncbi:MAG TPA: SDR family NAD(P)-dependent oxidoreductase [Bryobacteraceae bacterium]|nr:SDR family NAD(P)-dependent oxidoreductase [Bryobacteraceae bacterium]